MRAFAFATVMIGIDIAAPATVKPSARTRKFRRGVMRTESDMDILQAANPAPLPVHAMDGQKAVIKIKRGSIQSPRPGFRGFPAGGPRCRRWDHDRSLHLRRHLSRRGQGSSLLRRREFR